MSKSNLVPDLASHRINDLLSNESSNEAKGNAARWYAEMMIFEFLLTGQEHAEHCQGDSLGELIRGLEGKYDRKIVESLRLIKTFGDRASHYAKGKRVSNEEVKKAVEAAIGLYPLIIIDHLKKEPLDLHPDRASLLSTLPPSIRFVILSEIIDFDMLDDEYHCALLHKWCLACVKSGKRDKARRRLHDLKKKGKITDDVYSFESMSVDRISEEMAAGNLPIPASQKDFARNLMDMKSRITKESLIANSGLIKLLDAMAENITPSEFDGVEGMRLFAV